MIINTTGTQSSGVTNKDLLLLRFSYRTRVLRGGRSLRSSHKTFACARVFVATPLCVFLRAFVLTRTHTFVFPFFFCPPTPTPPHQPNYPVLPRNRSRFGEKPPGRSGVQRAERRRGRTAIVRWVSAHTLLCCVHQLSRCSSCSAPRCSGSFGIFDIFRIFPPSLCWFRARPI